MLSIIVLNYNRLEYTKQTVSNLIKKTKVEHEFIFVDNGSTDGTREYLRSLLHKTNAKQVRCIFNDKNLGVAGGRNIGLKVAEGDYLMTIDDDIIVPDNYDGYLIEACDKIPNLGITGISVERKNYSIRNINGVNLQFKDGNLNGGCLCMPRRTFEKVGYFYAFAVYGGEDCDMYIRIKQLKLISAYIVPKGIHIDKGENVKYKTLKKSYHTPKSKVFQNVGNNELKYKRSKNVYVPYMTSDEGRETFDKVVKKKPT